MSSAQRADDEDEAVVALLPLLRKVVAAKIRDPHAAEDLVQEALSRVMAVRYRLESEALAPYAVVTARNLVARQARNSDLARKKAHLLRPAEVAQEPDEEFLRAEEDELVTRALAVLSPDERDLLLAHEVRGVAVRDLAEVQESTPGAVAALLNRTRAKLRVEYLLAREGAEPPSDRCRPVLRAVSLGDRRRQRELDVGGHLLECDLCSRMSTELLERRGNAPDGAEVVIRVEKDADVVTSRRRGREVALRLGFGPAEATLLATAISEMARNVVKFAVRGEVRILPVSRDGQEGVTVVVRDVGPGIRDLDEAMKDGYSTYEGLGIGLPGTRRLMDQFTLETEIGKGTTVTMTKWRSSRGTSTATGGRPAVPGGGRR